MIKRALGLWADATPFGSGDVDDSDEELTPEEQRKLERRMVPGAKKAAKGKQATPTNRKASVMESDDESEGSDDSGGGWASEDPSTCEESDDGVAMPPSSEQEKPFRGAFRCQLCPDKILLNEKLLEAHLQSAAHKKAERRLERAKALGVEAFEAECIARKKAREALKSGVKSKRQLKSVSYWDKKRKKLKGNDEKEAEQEKLPGKEKKPEELSKEDIEKRKSRFQAKKARRLELRQAGADSPGIKANAPSVPADAKRKSASVPSDTKRNKDAPPIPSWAVQKMKAEPVKDASAVAAPTRLNRQARRLALQATYAAKGAPAETQAPATVHSEERPRKKRK